MKVPFVDLPAQWAPLKKDILKDWEDILDHASFVGGDYLEKFEAELSVFCNTRYAVGVSSGTSALVAILRGLEIGPGDTVAVQAETFIATAYAVKQVGAKVELIPDWTEYTHLSEKLPSHWKAAIVVHMYGSIDNLVCQELKNRCSQEGIYLIEDGAQALGAKGFGSYGIATSTSFYPAKNLGCAGQGGAVLTNDGPLATKVNWYANQGHVALGIHTTLGSNERLHSIQAAILRHGLKMLPEWNANRISIGERYNNEIVLRSPIVNEANCVYHLYPVTLNSPEERESLSQFLKDNNIANARHYPYSISQQDGFRTAGCEYIEEMLSCSLTLPIFPTMSDEQVEYVIDKVNEWLERK